MRTQSNAIVLAMLIAAAALEVGGDALIRRGLRGHALALVIVGFVVLGSYGVVVNFSRLLGVYVAVFAVVSVLVGRFVFGERIATSTWVGLSVIVAGSAIIQFGGARAP
jgi:small multidrug resistance family-3 protein